MQQLTLLSVFTGAMGLDLGFEQTGFDVRAAVDNDRYAGETIKANKPDVPVIRDDVSSVSGADLLDAAELKVGEATALIGASPCEPFSTIGKRLSTQDKRASLIDEFIRLITETEPEYWVFENVPGLKWAARKHISFYTRTNGTHVEQDDERTGSAWDDVLEAFEGTGYEVSYDLLNAADFGTPQKRRRLIVIGSRDGSRVGLPKPSHGDPQSIEVVTNQRLPWLSVGEALAEFKDPYPEHAKFPKWGKYLKDIPEGGCWRNLPDDVQQEAMGGAYYSSGGRTGFLRRLSSKRPSPTLVDSPITRAACLCHPTEARPLTVGEYLKLQDFPEDWKVEGPRGAKYRLIGQATPVSLAKVVAKAVAAHRNSRRNRADS